MADLYVVTWFRREPRPKGSHATGWTRGAAAFTAEADALAAHRGQLEAARANAGLGRGEIPGDPVAAERAASDLRLSNAVVAAYTLTGRPTVATLADLVSNPPQPDVASTGGTWFTEARIVRRWTGQAEARKGGSPR